MKKPKTYRPASTGAKKFELHNRKEKYNNEWRIYSKRFLHHNPFCYACGLKSTDVDHIYQAKLYPQFFEVTTNHLPLCKSCHSYITASFDRSRVNMVREKLEWINARREQTGTGIKVKVLPYYSAKQEQEANQT